MGISQVQTIFVVADIQTTAYCSLRIAGQPFSFPIFFAARYFADPDTCFHGNKNDNAKN